MLIKQRKRWMYFKFLRKFVSFWIEAEQDSLTVLLLDVSLKNGGEMYS